MKWGVRRYQNPDGSLTEAGRRRYGKMSKDTKKFVNDYMHYKDMDYNSPEYQKTKDIMALAKKSLDEKYGDVVMYDSFRDGKYYYTMHIKDKISGMSVETLADKPYSNSDLRYKSDYEWYNDPEEMEWYNYTKEDIPNKIKRQYEWYKERALDGDTGQDIHTDEFLTREGYGRKHIKELLDAFAEETAEEMVADYSDKEINDYIKSVRNMNIDDQIELLKKTEYL